MPVERRLLVLALGFLLSLSSAPGQFSKGHQILIDRGLQVQGLANDDCYVTFTTYTNLYYNSICWLNEISGGVTTHSSRNPWMGDPPGFPWSRWAIDETQMPPQITPYGGDETPYLSQLLALCLGDEWNLNDPVIRDRAVNWFVAVRTDWPNTILYHNSWGSQVADTNLWDFYTRAQPDMLCFDTYPWKSVWDSSQPDHIGSPIVGPPTAFYGDLRRYREHARGAGLPLGLYRQTFHSVQDYDYTVYRDPSLSEIRLNTFAGLAFGVTFFNDFRYNVGSSSLFTKTFNGSGDTVIAPNGLYQELADVDRRARNLGKAMVRLKPISTEGRSGYTTSMLFIRGRDPAGNLNPLPVGFFGDQDTGGDNASYSDWVYQRNDPYLTNTWTVANLGSRNNGQAGDVIISWFRPLDETFDGPDYANELYLIVVNGLAWTNGTAADCAQRINLNFHSSLAGIEMLNPLTGTAELQLLPLVDGSRQLELNLNGGDAVLFKFSDGAPFVGTQLAPVSGPPVITIHPASRSNVRGTDAFFTVRALGSPILTYQWQFDGTNIAEATTNIYTRTFVEADDVGSYQVVVSNSFGVVTSTPAALTLWAAAPLLYEPFDYTNVGGAVSANTPANWAFGGSGANDFSLVTGSLSYAGLVASVGNSATNGGTGLGVRRIFPTTINSGKAYFSVLFQMNDLGYGSWNGASTPIASFTASDNTAIRLGVLVRSNSPSGYLVGVRKGGTGAIDTFDTAEYHSGETILLVGQYDFTVTPNAVKLWIKPSPSTFAYAEPPPNGFITANTGTDNFTIDRFNFRQNTPQSVPAAMQWDELRVGLSWLDVTPPSVPFAPSISSQPTNQTVAVGSTANFYVLASGSNPLNYQWHFAGTNLVQGTNSVYTRTNTERYHAGSYSVSVSNIAGTITSSNAALTVTPVSPVLLSVTSNDGTGGFFFQGSGDGGEFAIEGSTNLLQWATVTNVFSPNGIFQYTAWLSNAPQNFFRARLVP